MIGMQLEDLSSDEEALPERKIRLTQFEYPPDEFKHRKFRNLEQILRWFEETPVKDWKYIQKMYTCRSYINKTKDCRKVIFECRQCHIKIIVKVEQGKGKVLFDRFENHHRHVMNHRTKMLEQQMIFQFFSNLDPSQKYHDYYRVAKEKFQINDQRLRYVMNKFIGRHTETLQDAITRVKSEVPCQFKVWRDNTKFNRDSAILMVTETMKQNYLKYGDCLCFDFTYRLIRKQRYWNQLGQMEQEQYSTGFFLGQDSNMRMVLFGVCLVKSQSAECIKEVFRAFFAIMGNKSPETIITDDQGAVGKALRQLKKEQEEFTYIQLLDQFHKLQALKRLMIKNNITREKRAQLLKLFSTLMKETNPIIFKQQVQQLKAYVDDKSIVDTFLYEKNLHCTSQVGKKFFGMSIASVRVEGFNNIIKTYVPYSTHIPRFFKQILRVQRHLNNRTGKTVRAKVQLVDQSLHMKVGPELKDSLESRIYDTLISHVSRIGYLDYIEPVDLQSSKKNNRVVHVMERGFKYELTYHNKIGFWNCSCNYIYHTGIPCVHLMMVLAKFKVNVLPYIKPRWIRKEENIEIGKKENVNTLYIPYRKEKTVNELMQELKPSGYLLLHKSIKGKFQALKAQRKMDEYKHYKENPYVKYKGQNRAYHWVNSLFFKDLKQKYKIREV